MKNKEIGMPRFSIPMMDAPFRKSFVRTTHGIATSVETSGKNHGYAKHKNPWTYLTCEAPHSMAKNRTTPAGKQIPFHLLPRVVRSWFPARLQLMRLELYQQRACLPPSKQLLLNNIWPTNWCGTSK